MNKTKHRAKLSSFHSITTLQTKWPLNDSQSKRFVRKRDRSNDSCKGNRTTPRSFAKNLSFKDNEEGSPKITQSIKTPSYIKKKELLQMMKTEVQDNDNDIKLFEPYTPKSIQNQGEFRLPLKFRQKFNKVRERNETQYISNWDDREELQLKNSQIMILSDENKRLRKKLQKLDKLELEEQKLIQKCKQGSLKLKNSEYRNQQLTRQNDILTKKIGGVQKNFDQLKGKYEEVIKNYDEVVLQNEQLIEYYDQYMQKNIPKEFREIQSYREIALEKQLQQLKKTIKKSISERESELEAQIDILRNSYSNELEKVRSSEIFARVMTKKLQQTDDVFLQNIRLQDQMNHVRNKYKNLANQNSLLRKANQAIKKNVQMKMKMKMMKSGYRIKTSNSDDSLNFSNLSS